MAKLPNLSFKKEKPAPPQMAASSLIAVTPEPEWLGWRLATFAVDTLLPAPGTKTPSTSIWQAYRDWCRKGKCVPLALPVFQSRFDELAAEVGIGRFQNGAHVLYRDLTLRKA